MQNREQHARVIFEAVTTATRRASAGPLPVESEQIDDVFELFFLAFVVHVVIYLYIPT